MTDYNTQLSVLDVINNVLRRLGISPVSSIDQTSLSKVQVDLLNDVLEDLSQYSSWPQMYTEASATFSSSINEYKLDIKAQSIEEIAVSGQVSPMQIKSRTELRRLARLQSYGVPRHATITKVSGLSPYIRVHPTPNFGGTFQVAYHTKPKTVRASAGNNGYLIPFPGRVVVQGLYAAALLEENGNQQTTEVIAAYKMYADMRKGALNAFVYDTGEELQFTPVGRML